MVKSLLTVWNSGGSHGDWGEEGAAHNCISFLCGCLIGWRWHLGPYKGMKVMLYAEPPVTAKPTKFSSLINFNTIIGDTPGNQWKPLCGPHQSLWHLSMFIPHWDLKKGPAVRRTPCVLWRSSSVCLQIPGNTTCTTKSTPWGEIGQDFPTPSL